ncbi:MAG TPA: hypothetical protein ENN33_07100 [Ignavibacteria bacterium]|nr:hypothetical protein [Ignavibacteria bacterium]
MNNTIEKIMIDHDANRINKFDEQWYEIVVPGEKNPLSLPSVTTYLQAYPKGIGFKLWLQRVGERADAIRDEAAQLGILVHRLIESILRGETITFENEAKERICSVQEWERFLSWCLWYQEYREKYNLEPIAIEQIVFDIDRKTAGTIDLIAKMTITEKVKVEGQKKHKEIKKDILKIFDWKTGQYIGDTAKIQVSVYQDIVNKMKVFGKIESAEIVQLYPNLNKKGFRIHEIGVGEISENIEAFEACQKIFNKANPNFAPKHLSYPNVVNLDFLNTKKLNLKGGENDTE